MVIYLGKMDIPCNPKDLGAFPFHTDLASMSLPLSGFDRFLLSSEEMISYNSSIFLDSMTYFHGFIF